MTRTSSGRVLTIWRTITQIRLTDEQKSDFVTHDALDELDAA